jgi:polypyrimidine tract-binding protein 1
VVLRVKILFNKRDTALVQYADPLQAQNAMTQLDKVKWWGKILKVSGSKHSMIKMPNESAGDSWMTKDFSNSPLNRFRNATKSPHNLAYPPSATLHLSNIPTVTTEDELKDLFMQYGNVVTFRFFPNDRRMALVQMGSQEEAVSALVALHNHRLSGDSYLRVSFTKSVISRME